MTDPLVTAAWLKAQGDGVVILDATYFLPPDPGRSRQDYLDAHIPGARLFEGVCAGDPPGIWARQSGRP